jgi:hypothetical protein
VRKTMETSGELKCQSRLEPGVFRMQVRSSVMVDENLKISGNILVCMVVKMGFVSQENNTMNFVRQCWTEEIRGVLKNRNERIQKFVFFTKHYVCLND